MTTDCCAPHDPKTHKPSFDYILWGSMAIMAVSLILYFSGMQNPYTEAFARTVIEMIDLMWWGVALGIIFVGLMNKIPREYFAAVLGNGDSFSGIVRAAIAGLFLDVCSHGILIVGAKLYERGASAAQVMTFLIASPWNSVSLTIVLIAMIGLKWTMLFIAGSALIAIASGLAFRELVKTGFLPPNPHTIDLPAGFSLMKDARQRWRGFKLTPRFFQDVFWGGMTEANMLLRWLFLSVVIAATIRTFMPLDMFASWFGPSLLGLGMTLIAATIIEVCSEGSAPLAAELMNRAGAPGNAFTFLMAGVATDYTEILVLREATKSWKIALTLPLVTVPQIVILSILMNGFYLHG